MNIRSALVASLLVCAWSIAACTNAAVDQAVGTPAGDPQILVTTSASAVSVENHVGRPLLNVRISVTTSGSAAPFSTVVPTIGANETRDILLNDFRTEDGTLLDAAASRPATVSVAARDTLGNSYAVTSP